MNGIQASFLASLVAVERDGSAVLLVAGVVLFLAAVVGLGWLAWQQASESDLLARRMEMEQERKRQEWRDRLAANRARLRKAIQHGDAA